MPYTPYDQIADEYYDASHKTSRNFDATTIAAFVKQKPRIKEDGLVLEVGAGRGRCHEFLGIDHERVVQLDISEAMLALEPRERCRLRVVHAAETLPFMDGEFSCVAAFLCDPFLGLDFLSEAFRVLHVGGTFVATTPSFEWGSVLRKDLKLDNMKTRFMTRLGKTVTVPSILVSRSRLLQMLTHVGFQTAATNVDGHGLPEHAEPVSPDLEAPAKILKIPVHELDILYTIIAEKRV